MMVDMIITVVLLYHYDH